LASANEFRSAPGAPAAKVLAVRELCKSYGKIVAVDRISFDVGRGEIVGLLGPNGAGKTTTINMILGVLEPDSGNIRIEELDIAANRSRALERTNFTAVYAPLPGLLASTVFGLSFFAYGLALVQFLLALFVFGIALGVFACAVVLRLGPAAEWFIWPIPALLSPFAGVFYPLSTLPKWMQLVSNLLPPAYVFEGPSRPKRGLG